MLASDWVNVMSSESSDETLPDSLFDLHRHDATELQEYITDTYGVTDGLVDAIVTSPPYADLIEYGDEDGQIGQQGYEAFLDDLRAVFEQCYNLASESCTLWVITDTLKREGRVIRLPTDIADEVENLPQYSVCQNPECETPLDRNRGTGVFHCPACESTYDPLGDSWRLEDTIVWDKQRTRPWNHRGRLRNVHEHISMYSKTEEYTYDLDAIRTTDPDAFERWWVDYPERYNPNGMAPANVWEYPIPKQGQWGPKHSYHPSPLPRNLLKRIILLSTDPGDVVLDPFGGVGTTLAIADGLDRRGIGFELNQEYIDYYHDHVEPTVLDELRYEQQELADPRAELRSTIWALRIHKYAVKLYQEMVEMRDSSVSRGDIAFILVDADPSVLEVKQSGEPTATLTYVSDPRVEDVDVSIQDARNGLISENKGSGDYYGVEFDVTVRPYEEVTEAIGTEPTGLFTSPSTICPYTGGVHHWHDEPLEWSTFVENLCGSEWRRFYTKRWPPLFSRLAVRVENPMDDTEKTATGRQAGIGQFD